MKLISDAGKTVDFSDLIDKGKDRDINTELKEQNLRSLLSEHP